ncbi:hypothetical protein [Citricoccus alkalitolerans]|uniref:Uncharacterized protein n=1 Tax=Citricoccus alkalitolerans TaxID=246603 RepID=A0ABV8XWC3_9MICC
MRAGDRIWAYLSRRQEVCAVGVVREIVREAGRWFVMVEWDESRTDRLCRDPLGRSTFVQVPLSTCRADAHASTVLSRRYVDLGSVSAPPAPSGDAAR